MIYLMMLTARQTLVYDFIRQLLPNMARHRRSPKSLMAWTRSVNAAVEHVKALAKKGVIDLLPNVS